MTVNQKFKKITQSILYLKVFLKIKEKLKISEEFMKKCLKYLQIK